VPFSTLPRVITFAVLSGTIPKLGVILVAVLAAAAMLSASDRAVAASMLGALILAPVLLLADIWHSPQLSVVHRHPVVAVVGTLLALGVLAAAALLLNRRPMLLGPLAVLALPFRIPISAGGSSANLLVPLYLVVAAGALSFLVPALRSRTSGQRTQRGWPERLLALYIVLYAVQALYSPDFEKALQQVVFFYVPFSLLFCLLRRLTWTPELIRTCLKTVVVLALLFAGVGFVEYGTKTIFLNPKLVAANDVHAYFTVNSVFFDPDIFGRFLALVMIAVAVLLLYERERREQLTAIVVLAVLWVGLVLTLSRSSLAALLVGLGATAALRWRVGRVLAVAAAVVAVGAAAVAISPKTFGLNQGLNGASSGRANLVSGGIHMFGNRLLWGYGSGSFVHEYRGQHPGSSQTLSASHTIPVTIGAEQGLIGELPYVALVIVSAVVLLRGARANPTRVAVGAAFLALMFHTMLYADFLEDPVTWTLLGIGLALARAPRRQEPAPPPTTERAQTVPA
jgi:putative inorganic carbon (hco3(-)) transporter